MLRPSFGSLSKWKLPRLMLDADPVVRSEFLNDPISAKSAEAAVHLAAERTIGEIVDGHCGPDLSGLSIWRECSPSFGAVIATARQGDQRSRRPDFPGAHMRLGSNAFFNRRLIDRWRGPKVSATLSIKAVFG